MQTKIALAVRASCLAEVAPVRVAPRDDAEQVTQLLRGEPVTVLETRDGWARIETAYAYPGWTRDEALGPAAAGEWLPRREGDVLDEARAYLGAPYEWGGMTEAGIDCSGLVHMAFRRLGVLVPRDSWQQGQAGTEVAEEDLRPGDLVCYERHVAFWLGGGRILHASGRAGVEGVLEQAEPAQLRASFLSYRHLVTD
jgi:cell wall-associated NlpC family hydrolase